jgi:hypothetical protein
MCGCETQSLTLREEHRLRVLESRVLRGLFGLKGDKVIGSRRKLHSKELHNLYFFPRIIRMSKSRGMRWAGHVARLGVRINAYRILRNPEGRPRHTWVDNIKIDLKEVGWDGMDWIHLAQDRDQWRALVKTVMNLWVS